MEEKFNIVYNRLKEVKVDENILCRDFWLKVLRLHQNFDEKECWDLMVNHISWLFKAKSIFNIATPIITSAELQQWFSEEELNKHHIFTKGKHQLKNGLFIGLGTADLEVSGHSEVLLFDNARAEVFDTSFCKGYDNSYFEVNDCIGNTFDDANARAIGTSIIEVFGDGKVTKGSMALLVDSRV